MIQQEMAACHCIIGHPSKAKFLAIKNEKNWSLPRLKFPAGRTDYRSQMITQGVQRIYGLKTRVLRALVSMPNYHILELELAADSSGKKIEAVWVDRKQYLKIRHERKGGFDPFENWLKEREGGIQPDMRPQWQFPGWFKKADHWINFQLENAGVQSTGSIKQHRVGWSASCLLTAPSNEGRFYFKAGYAKPPMESTATNLMVQKWPKYVFEPVAVNVEMNWMLNREFKGMDAAAPGPEVFADFARIMGEIQVGSVEDLDDWEQANCPLHDINYLLALIENKEEFLPVLALGAQPLSESELAEFMILLKAYEDLCQQLNQHGIPNMLVHTDFRDDNMIPHESGNKIIDWTDVVIGHPFFCLERVLNHRIEKHDADSDQVTFDPLDDETSERIIEAYLESFTRFGSMHELKKALSLSRSLHPFWRFCTNRYELDWVEKGSPAFRLLAVQLQNAVRAMLKDSSIHYTRL
jgi:hypothetical protein